VIGSVRENILLCGFNTIRRAGDFQAHIYNAIHPFTFPIFWLSSEVKRLISHRIFSLDGAGQSYDGPGGYGARLPKRGPKRERDDKVHESIIEERIQRERPCRTLFIRNIKASVMLNVAQSICGGVPSDDERLTLVVLNVSSMRLTAMRFADNSKNTARSRHFLISSQTVAWCLLPS
jgi:hypothetical protein